MRFQRRIMLLYMVLGLFLSVFLGLSYYGSNMHHALKNEYQNLDTVSKQYEQQWEEYVKPMDSYMRYVLSDQEMLESLFVLAKTPFGKTARRRQASKILSLGITSDYTINTFYRVLLFNPLGDVTASNDYGATSIRKDMDIDTIPWLAKVEDTRGENVLIGRHKDDWGIRSTEDVFSIVKKIQGENLGFIEIQRRIADLENVFKAPDDRLHILVFDTDGEILYSSSSYDNLDFYREYIKTTENTVERAFNTVSGEEEVIAVQKAQDERVSILVSREMRTIREQFFYIIPYTFLLATGLFAFMFIYTWLSSRRLVKPIRQLKEYMDTTQLDNIQDEREIAVSGDEIELLSYSYKRMLERLNSSIQREQRLSYLQLQAQYDLLQAQINPHFIYNVLNVISNRGIENDDEEICELCDSLAQMLRYSTGNKKRYVTIEEELQYVKQYFYLLHSRYEYRLEYEIDVDREIYGQILPKIVLQQIVENAVHHGFEKTGRRMHISLNGRKEGSRWYLQIRDNGNGFSEEILKEQRERIQEIREQLTGKHRSIEMEIGGMGLVNTYARLYLVYGEDLEFRLENLDSMDGACVTVLAPMGAGEECIK